MKRLIALLLIFTLLLCGCGSQPQETEPTEVPTEASTEAPTEAPTEDPTEAPTEPPIVYRHPLTGAPLETPHTTRIVSLSIGNTYDAMPTLGLSQVDMLFEMYVNGLTTRFLALFGDPTGIPAIGSIRSHRYHFTDISQSYDTLAFHAGYSNAVGGDTARSGIPHMNVDTNSSTSYSFRDEPRNASGIARMHCLMAKGDGLYAAAEKKGYSIEFNPDKDYRMNFTDESALTEGDPAGTVTLTFSLSDSRKKSIFTYNAETGLYAFSQYGKDMVDGNNDLPVTFRNLFFLFANTWTDANGYHVSNLIGSGDGWFACDGYIIPIIWNRESDTDPFSFTLADGTPLVQGVGNSYIAIAPTQSSLEAE